MTMFKRAKLLAFGVAVSTLSTFAVAPAGEAAAVQKGYFTIGTGSVTGVYYPAGGAICRLVNRGKKEHGIRCSVESTGGTVYNLNALRSSELDMAVVQSDGQYHAYKGNKIFEEKGAFTKLRSLFSLHSEAFTVVARSDANIKSFKDIVGKRINVGEPGSGMRATMNTVMSIEGWDKSNFKSVSELKASEQPQALCDNKIDVMVYIAGHPNGAVQEATTQCDTKIVSLEDDLIKKIITNNPYFARATIPGGMYPGTPNDVKTFGVKATVVTTSDKDEEVIYQIVKSVFENFDNFRTLHPVFVNLDPKHMVFEGNTAPLHKGAERYFREKGYIKATATKK